MNEKQKIVSGAGAFCVFLCFVLELVTNNLLWGALALAITMACAARYYALAPTQEHILDRPIITLLEEQKKAPQPEPFFEEGVYRDMPTSALPHAPSFPHTLPDMDEKNFILGYAYDKLLGKSVPVQDDMDEGVMSTSVIGKPKRGKTTLLYFLIAQMILKKSDIMIFDPHATLSKLKSIFPYAHNCATIIANVPAIHQELDARMLRYEQNGGVCLDNPFWLVVDELPLLSLHELMLKKNKVKFQSAIDAIQRIILEGRKFRMYCLVSGQSMPATVLPTLARDNIASHYAFFCSDDHARMSGFNRKTIKELLPQLRMAIGTAILDAATMEKAIIVAIPYTNADHIYTLVRTQSYSGIKTFSPTTDPLRSIVSIPGFGDVEKDIVDRILKVASDGNVSRRADICGIVGVNNRYYPVVKHVCDQHGLLNEKVRSKEETA